MNPVVTASVVSAILGAAGLSAAPAVTYAHEWYPVECCADRDCTRANAIVLGSLSNMIVVVGDHRIEIPAGFAVRDSPDSQVHICFQTSIDEMDGSVLTVPNCLFLPAQS
jgi:hypothetical protein